MGLWIASFFIKKIIPVSQEWEKPHYERIKKLNQTIQAVSQGSLAKRGLEVGKGLVVRSVGTYLGTCYPAATLAAGVVLRTSQKGSLDKLQGVAASSLTALVVLLLSSQGYVDLTLLDQTSLQFLVTMVGGMTGSWMTGWMAGKEPVGNPEKPFVDGHFSRSVRSSLTKEALRAAATPLGIPWLIQYGVAEMVGLGAVYAFPLTEAYQSGNRFPSYATYDPNLLIKIMAHTHFGNTALFAASLTNDLTAPLPMKRLMTDLLTHGITHQYGVNFLVRTFNRYSTLIQNAYIQVALKDYTQALLSNDPNLASKKEWLEYFLYLEILKTENFSARPVAPRAVNDGIRTAVRQLTKLENEVFGLPVSNPAHTQALLEIHAQGLIHFALNTVDKNIQNAPQLTTQEIHDFYHHLGHLFKDIYPSRATQLLTWAIPVFLFGDRGLFHLTLNGLALDRINEDQIDEELYFDSIGEEDDGEIYFDALDEDEGDVFHDALDEPSLFPADPTNLLRVGAHYHLGSTQALIDQLNGKIPLVPMLHTLIKKMVTFGIDSDLFLNSFVRAVNGYTDLVCKNENVRFEVNNFLVTRDKVMGKKLLNKSIRKLIDSSLTKSFAIGVVHTLSRPIAEGAKQIIQQMTSVENDFYKFSPEELANYQELLEIHLTNLTLMAIIRAGENRLQMTRPDIDQFYLNLNQLVWSPLLDPTFNPLKNGLAVVIPSLVENSGQILSYFPAPLAAPAPERKPSTVYSRIRGYIRHSLRYVWVKTTSVFHYFRKLFK